MLKTWSRVNTKNLFVLALLSLSVSCPFCPAQTTVVVDVKDESTAKCPARMGGTIEMTESDVNGENRTSFVSLVTTTNLSNVPIVAMVTYTHIGNSLGGLIGANHQLDAFFAHDLEIAPGQTYTHKHTDNGVISTPLPKNYVKLAPVASSQIIFVQFADGSTCGDINDGRVVSLMDTRADLLQDLKTIDNAAKIGESEFLKALAKEPTDRTGNAGGIIQNIRDMQKEKGSTVAIDYIRSMLDVAASR